MNYTTIAAKLPHYIISRRIEREAEPKILQYGALHAPYGLYRIRTA